MELFGSLGPESLGVSARAAKNRRASDIAVLSEFFWRGELSFFVGQNFDGSVCHGCSLRGNSQFTKRSNSIEASAAWQGRPLRCWGRFRPCARPPARLSERLNARHGNQPAEENST